MPEPQHCGVEELLPGQSPNAPIHVSATSSPLKRGDVLWSGSPSSVTAIFQEFRKIVGCASKDVNKCSSMTVEDLTQYWEKLALNDLQLRGRPFLTGQAKQAIALRAAQLVQDMDLNRKGEVFAEEWLHYILLAKSGCSAMQVNGLLDKAMRRNKNILIDLQRMFEAADTTMSGNLSFAEIVSMYSKKMWNMKPDVSGSCKSLTEEEARAGDPEKFAQEVVEAMDINGDTKVSYSEFMAYSLGRRKHQVLLYLYDLSNGSAPSVSPWILGQTIEGVWHTGVVVYGKEYYYSKDTVYADAGDTSFGKPTRVVDLGHTLWRQHELHEFVTVELKPVFQRDTYDVVCNNCNHFSDRVCMFLVGKHLPLEVLKQPEMLLKARSVRWMRPILNWWLRDRIVARENGKELPAGTARLKPEDQPSVGTLVRIHPSVGVGLTIVGQVACWDREAEVEGFPVYATPRPSNIGCPGERRKGGLESAGCNGFWSGTCGVVRGVTTCSGPGGIVLPDHVCVACFDVPSVGSVSTAHPQVRVEMIPCSRLSYFTWDEHGEELYKRALQGFGSNSEGIDFCRMNNVSADKVEFADEALREQGLIRARPPSALSQL